MNILLITLALSLLVALLLSVAPEYRSKARREADRARELANIDRDLADIFRVLANIDRP